LVGLKRKPIPKAVWTILRDLGLRSSTLEFKELKRITNKRHEMSLPRQVEMKRKMLMLLGGFHAHSDAARGEKR